MARGKETGRNVSSKPCRIGGNHYRSMLEARWAIVMESMSIDFDYEPATFELDDVLYVPDFWLPKSKRFIEVKPQTITKEEFVKTNLLLHHKHQPVFILSGFPTITKDALSHANVFWHDGQILGPGVPMTTRYLYALGLEKTEANKYRLIESVDHARTLLAYKRTSAEEISSILARVFKPKPDWPKIVKKSALPRPSTAQKDTP